MKSSTSPAERLLCRILPWVAVAAVLGGSVFWLRLVGWLQVEEYWIAHARWFHFDNQEEDSAAAYRRFIEFKISVQTLSWPWTLSKWPKQLLLIAVVAVAISQWRPWRRSPPWSWLGVAVLALALFTAASALWAGLWLNVIAGARSFVSWGLAVMSPAIASVSVLRALARTLAWTLVVQTVMVLIELHQGMLLYSVHLFDRDIVRVVGSFNLPASLGSFAVVAWFASYCWGELRPRTLLWLAVALGIVLVPNGSAVAWVSLVMGLAAIALSRLQQRWRIVLLLAALPTLLLLWQGLPQLTGRADVHTSLWGRIQPVHEYAAQRLSTTEVLLGLGFGEGTNALSAQVGTAPIATGALPDRPVGDSLPATLFWQIGLVGVVLAYLWMAMALRADPRSRPVGVALIVSSVAINITELFPVNLVLGFWLAHAARAREDDDAAA